MSSSLTYVIFFAAGAVGGALNAVAGGGSFIVFPLMLLSGISPVIANATTAVSLWPAGVASSLAYRAHLPRERKTLLVLSLASAIGGGLGAALLLSTGDQTFSRILPLLMLAASLVFTFGPRVSRRAREHRLSLVVGASIQIAIAAYGGYFGGGMGIMMLAVFTLMGMEDLHAMNGIKVLSGVLINGVALIAFVAAQKVVYDVAFPVAAGALVGGFAGADAARRIDPKHVRKLVLAVAWSLTAWFAYRSLLR